MLFVAFTLTFPEFTLMFIVFSSSGSSSWSAAAEDRDGDGDGDGAAAEDRDGDGAATALPDLGSLNMDLMSSFLSSPDLDTETRFECPACLECPAETSAFFAPR